jgi:autotransporter-associated beta strand protein
MTITRRAGRTLPHPHKPALSLLSAGLMLAFSPAHALQIFDVPLAQTFSGAFSGPESVTKSGAGMLTFTGANTYTGLTIITAGTLQIGNGGTTGSIASNIQNAGVVAFNRSDYSEYAGNINGSGSLTKLGAGTLRLLGNNSYTGGTTISQGLLQLGNLTGTAGYISGNVTNNAGLEFVHTSNTFGGVISGSGYVTKSGSGTLVLTGNNTYSGGTTIMGGVLIVGSGTTGSIVGNVTNNSTLAFNRTDNISFAGLISGTGGLTKMGSNTLTLTGNNTYTGVTTIHSGGTLQIGNGGTTGSIAGNIANTGAVVFNRSNNNTFAGAISGQGSLTKMGSNTLTLTGANTHTGGTTLSGGTLQIGNGGTTGSITGSIANAGAVVFNRSDNSTFAGAISGSGSLTKLGAGTLTLSGANTHTGGTTIAAGTLEIGLYGSIQGDIYNNSTLAFNAQNTYGTTYVDGAISGSGNLVKSGGGSGSSKVVLTGTNTYTGGTTITTGTLQIGNGGTTGSIVGDVVNNGTLAFGRSDDTSFAGIISGSGGVTKSGAGTLTITGNNTYTGITNIQGGTLQIGNGGTTGWIAGAITGGTLIFNRSDDIALSAGTSSTLVKQGSGTLTFTGQKFGGNVIVSNGTFQIGDGGIRGSVDAFIVNNSAVTFNRSDLTMFGAYSMSGSGSMSKLGAGTLLITGSNTYTGGTTISAGTLQIGQGYTYGSIVGNVTNNAALVFNRSDNITFAGDISGSGNLTKLGANTLTLTGAQTYSGSTTISAGTLAFAGAGNHSLAGAIDGSGGLVQSGSGVLVLGGASSYTGSTQVSGGTLKLDGSLIGTSGVNFAAGTTFETDASATIALGGTAGRIDVAGVLSPGGDGAWGNDKGGQLNLALGTDGKLGFAAGSSLLVDLALGDSIVFDQAGDWLDGSGNATLQLNYIDYSQTYTIFQNVSTQNFSFAGITGYDATYYTANFFQSGNDYKLGFTAVPVPETDTYLLMLAGLGLVGFRVRRRNNVAHRVA